LETVHRVTRLPLWAGGMVGLTVLSLFLAGLNSEVYWAVPYWVDLHSSLLRWGDTFLVLGYILVLTSYLAWSEHHPQRIPLSVIGTVIVLCLLTIRYLQNPPLHLHPEGKLTPEGYVLQSTGSSCAAASGANIAKDLGVETTEHEMVALMGTNGEGTSVAQVILGMRKLGIEGEKVIREGLEELEIPAMLFVDHIATGPESHAIVLLKNEEGQTVIVDPLFGTVDMTRFQTSNVWHGKAVEFSRN